MAMCEVCSRNCRLRKLIRVAVSSLGTVRQLILYIYSYVSCTAKKILVGSKVMKVRIRPD